MYNNAGLLNQKIISLFVYDSIYSNVLKIFNERTNRLGSNGIVNSEFETKIKNISIKTGI